MSTKLIDHTLSLYDALDQSATMEKFGESEMRIFRGSYLEVYDSLGISRHYYGKIRRALTDCSAISELQRGARNVLSVLALHGRPSEEVLKNLFERPLTDARPSGRVALERRVDDIETRLGGLDIGLAFAELHNRLSELEGETGEVVNGKSTT